MYIRVPVYLVLRVYARVTEWICILVRGFVPLYFLLVNLWILDTHPELFLRRVSSARSVEVLDPFALPPRPPAHPSRSPLRHKRAVKVTPPPPVCRVVGSADAVHFTICVVSFPSLSLL